MSSLTPEIIKQMMEAAYAEAARGYEEGGVPVGAALFKKDGTLIASGRNRRVQENEPSIHGETDAFRKAGRQAGGYRDLVMVTTLSPCWFCCGLIRQFGIGTVVVGENRNFHASGADGTGEAWLAAAGVDLVVVQDERCVTLMRKFITERPDVWNEDIGLPASEEVGAKKAEDEASATVAVPARVRISIEGQRFEIEGRQLHSKAKYFSSHQPDSVEALPDGGKVHLYAFPKRSAEFIGALFVWCRRGRFNIRYNELSEQQKETLSSDVEFYGFGDIRTLLADEKKKPGEGSTEVTTSGVSAGKKESANEGGFVEMPEHEGSGMEVVACGPCGSRGVHSTQECPHSSQKKKE